MKRLINYKCKELRIESSSYCGYRYLKSRSTNGIYRFGMVYIKEAVLAESKNFRPV